MITLDQTQISDFILEISDREIYNDIRSDITVQEEEEETTPIVPGEYDTDTAGGTWKVAPGVSYKTFSAKAGYTGITWLGITGYSAMPDPQHMLNAECLSWGGDFTYPNICHLPTCTPSQLKVTTASTVSNNCTVKVENNTPFNCWVAVHLSYRYKISDSSGGEPYTVTTSRTMRVSAIGETSIDKYGRRTMDLTWPLGQTESQMQTLVDAYDARYSEPVPMATMTLLGDTDEMVDAIFALKIDERVTISHNGLGMVDIKWFVNNVELSHDIEGILEGRYELEQARPGEVIPIFTLGVSLLGGTHVLG